MKTLRKDDKFVLYIGYANEIKPIYNSIWRSQNNDYWFSHSRKAKFNMRNVYGLQIPYNTDKPVCIIGESSLAHMILTDFE